MSYRSGRSAAPAAAIALVALLGACATPKLTNLNDVSSTLELSGAQRRVVRPSVERIQTILDDYEAAKDAFVEDVQGRASGRRGRGGGGAFAPGEAEGRETGRQEALRAFRAKREILQEALDAAILTIEAALDARQLAQLTEIELPELAMPEIGAGGGQRPGGGRGGGKGGGRGGRPGGMAF